MIHQTIYATDKINHTERTQPCRGGRRLRTKAGKRREDTFRFLSNVVRSMASPASLPADWREMRDKATGKVFFYNTNTRITSWERPTEDAVSVGAGQEAVDSDQRQSSGSPGNNNKSAWISRTDPGSGKVYYYNSDSKVTQWERPEGFMEGPSQSSEEKEDSPTTETDWVEKVDPSSGRVFYFNKKTQKTQWSKPKLQANAPAAQREGHAGGATTSVEAGTAQSSVATAASNDPKASKSQNPAVGNWVEMQDKASSRKYYYNKSTKLTQWNKPEELANKEKSEEESTDGAKSSTTSSSQPAKQASEASEAIGWTEMKDKASGRVFYYNKTTKKTQWTKPDELGSGVASAGTAATTDSTAAWVAREDPATKRKYYYNTETKKTQWETPDELKKTARTPKSDNEKIVDKTGGTPTRQSAPESGKAKTRGDWKEMSDKSTGKVFYYNTVTKKTQWSMPDDAKNNAEQGEKTEGEAIAATSDWKKMSDKKSGKVFYYNKVTKKTQWTVPDEMAGGTHGKSEDGNDATGAKPSEKLRRRSVVLQELSSQWTEMKDPKSGKVFYYNKTTGVSAWNKPKVDTTTKKPSEPQAAKQQPAGTATKQKSETPAGASMTKKKANTTPETAKEGDGAAMDEELPAAWKEMKDKVSGKVFYYNKDTKKTQWTRPTGPNPTETEPKLKPDESAAPTEKVRRRSVVVQQLEDDWSEMKDPKSGKVFFYNKKTGKSRWKKPSNAGELKAKKEATESTAEKEDDTSSVSSRPSEKMRRRSVVLTEPSEPDSSHKDWTKMKDPKSGKVFFYNKKTGVSAWKLPKAKLKQAVAEVAKGKRGSTSPKKRKDKGKVVGDWMEKVDKKGRKYYVNKATRATQWDAPDGFHDTVVPEDASAVNVTKESPADAKTHAHANYTKNVMKSGHLRRKTDTGIWRTEFIHLTTSDLCLSSTGEWKNEKLIAIPMVDIKSVDLDVGEGTEFVVTFVPGNTVGVPASTTRVFFQGRSTKEAVEWITEIDRLTEYLQDSYASAKTVDDGGASKAFVPMSHTVLMDFIENEDLPLDNYPSDEKMKEIEKLIETFEDRNYRLMKQIMWCEWRERHGLPRTSMNPNATLTTGEAGDSEKTPTEVEKQARRNDLVRRRVMLRQYAILVGLLRNEPQLLSSIGCSLPEKAQEEYAALLANNVLGLKSDPSVGDNFHKVVDATALNHSEAQSLLSGISGRASDRHKDVFLSLLLKYHAKRPESVAFINTIVDSVDFFSLAEAQNFSYSPKSMAMSNPRRSYSIVTIAPKRLRSPAARPLIGEEGKVKPGIQGAMLAIQKLCNSVTPGEVCMPQSVLAICQSLQDHPGPISGTRYLFGMLLADALEAKAGLPTTDSRIGRHMVAAAGHVRTITSPKLWNHAPLEYKSEASSARQEILSFMDRVAKVDQNIFSATKAMPNFGNDIKDRVVVSCFQLYLLHMAIHRYLNLPNAFPRPGPDVLSSLEKLGKPVPLPGTELWGSAENPFTVLVIKSEQDKDNAGIDAYASANLAVGNAKQYMERKVASDVAKNVHIALETTLKDIRGKVDRYEELEFMLEESKSRTLAIEDVIKSPKKQAPKLEDTISARSPRKFRKIVLAESAVDGSEEESPSGKIDNVYSEEYTMPLKSLMSPVFNPLHLGKGNAIHYMQHSSHKNASRKPFK
jgi:hypothetical protein